MAKLGDTQIFGDLNVKGVLRASGGKLDISRSVATLTSSNTSLDINQSSWNSIPWDTQLQIDKGYTHDPSGSHKITFDSAGTYRVKTMLSYVTNASARVNPGIKFAINGTRRNAIGLSGYVRNASGHDRASNYLEEIIMVSAGDTLKVQTYQKGSSGTVNMIANASNLLIEQIK